MTCRLHHAKGHLGRAKLIGQRGGIIGNLFFFFFFSRARSLLVPATGFPVLTLNVLGW